MLEPGNDNRARAIVGLAVLAAVLAVLVWRMASGDDVTINARPVGEVPVVAAPQARP